MPRAVNLSRICTKLRLYGAFFGARPFFVLHLPPNLQVPYRIKKNKWDIGYLEGPLDTNEYTISPRDPLLLSSLPKKQVLQTISQDLQETSIWHTPLFHHIQRISHRDTEKEFFILLSQSHKFIIISI